MDELIEVTVARVPVTVTIIGRELAVQVGRFDPQAAAGRLRVSRLSGAPLPSPCTSPATAGRTRRASGGRPNCTPAAGAVEQLLLCDGCFQAATGLLAECHDGLCLRDGPDVCQWCGARGRLREVPRAEVQRRLPTVGEQDKGMWRLHYIDGAQGPFPSARDYWHAHGDGQTPVPSQSKPQEAP